MERGPKYSPLIYSIGSKVLGFRLFVYGGDGGRNASPGGVSWKVQDKNEFATRSNKFLLSNGTVYHMVCTIDAGGKRVMYINGQEFTGGNDVAWQANEPRGFKLNDKSGWASVFSFRVWPRECLSRQQVGALQSWATHATGDVKT